MKSKAPRSDHEEIERLKGECQALALICRSLVEVLQPQQQATLKREVGILAEKFVATMLPSSISQERIDRYQEIVRAVAGLPKPEDPRTPQTSR